MNIMALIKCNCGKQTCNTAPYIVCLRRIDERLWWVAYWNLPVSEREGLLKDENLPYLGEVDLQAMDGYVPYEMFPLEAPFL